jgi:hypothetical protein
MYVDKLNFASLYIIHTRKDKPNDCGAEERAGDAQ